MVGRNITIAGSGIPANNGTFPITFVVPGVSVTFTNAAGMAEPVFPGTWIVNNATENLNVTLIAFQGAGAWTINSLASPGGDASFVFRGLILRGLTYVADPSLNDSSLIFDSVFAGGAPYTFTDIGEINILGVRTRGMTFAGGTFFNLGGGTALGGAITLAGTSSGTIAGQTIEPTAPIVVGAASSLVANAILQSTVTVAAGGTADVRGCNVDAANLIGPGTINRTIHTQSFTTTVTGPNPLVFAVPFPDAGYAVSLQPTGLASVVATVSPRVASKLLTGFTINDAVASGTGDSLTAGPAVTLADAGSFTADMVGRDIIIALGAAGNNGTFPITAVVPGVSVTFTNAAGVAELVFPGTWIVGNTYDVTVSHG
jgi:hypothetical protein